MAGPTYRGLRLDRSLAEFHRAVDRLRWDTDPHHTEELHPASPAPDPPSRPQTARDGPPTLDLPA
jgi:hypothetical protein